MKPGTEKTRRKLAGSQETFVDQQSQESVVKGGAEMVFVAVVVRIPLYLLHITFLARMVLLCFLVASWLPQEMAVTTEIKLSNMKQFQETQSSEAHGAKCSAYSAGQAKETDLFCSLVGTSLCPITAPE